MNECSNRDGADMLGRIGQWPGPGCSRAGRGHDVAAEAWRRERLYLYLYWLEHRDRSPFNFVGGWHTADIGDEVARWEEALDGLDSAAASELLDRELALRFGKCWQDAIRQGSSPLLAAFGQAVWNGATSSLLPSHLGPLTIFRAESYRGKPALGWSYNYGCASTGQKVSITLYDQGCSGLRDGVVDPRLAGQFDAAWLDIRRKFTRDGVNLLDATLRGPTEEVVLDRYNRHVALLARHGHAVDSDGITRVEGVYMRVFRGLFLKVRHTHRAPPGSNRGGAASLEAVKADLADYVASFS